MRFIGKCIDFLWRDEGPAAVEYAIMIALIILVCITAVTSLGVNASSVYARIASTLR